MNPAARLAQGAADLGVCLPADAGQRLLDYLALVEKWNKVYNLTAVRDRGEMLTRHVLDSLAIVPYLAASSLLDVGSGAGLPGIPLALALPRLDVTLLDASQKRAAFLRQAAIELRLTNVAVACARVEEWAPGRQFDLVVSRAVTELALLLRLAGKHVANSGSLAAMKGVHPHAELAQLPVGWRLAEAIRLSVPGVAAERHWVRVVRGAPDL